MGERKGVNKYYPPDYDPRKGGLNKSQGTHALRERAKKLHLGILVIRFEMPYNIWCEGCENHIGTGVRYNAEKKKVGMYYTTPIYEFRMKCHLCDNYFDIRTDPANLDYEIISGARRQERRWDPSENEQVAPEDKAINRKMAADAMFKLQHDTEDKDKVKEMGTVLDELEDLQASRWEDNYSANRLLRQKFRMEKEVLKAQELKDKSLNVCVPLLTPTVEDHKSAAILMINKNQQKPEPKNQSEISTESIFAKFKASKVTKGNKKEIAKKSLDKLLSNVKIPTENIYSKKFSNLVKVRDKNSNEKSEAVSSSPIPIDRISSSTDSGTSYNTSDTQNNTSPSCSTRNIRNDAGPSSTFTMFDTGPSSSLTMSKVGHSSTLTISDIGPSSSLTSPKVSLDNSVSVPKTNGLGMLANYSESDSSDTGT